VNRARPARPRDPSQALAQARAAIAAARRSGDQRSLAEALVLELSARHSLGEPVGNPHISAVQRVNLLVDLATWEATSGLRDAAVMTAFEARRQAIAIGDEMGVARATLRLGIPAVFSKVDRATVLAVLDEASLRFAALDYPTGSASAQFHAGVMLLFTMNDPVRALERFARMRELSTERSATAAAWTCVRLSLEATARVLMGQRDEAARIVAEVSALGERYATLDPRTPPMVRFARAMSAMSFGDTARAVEEFQTAADYATRLDMPEMTVEILRQLKRAFQHLRDRNAEATTAARLQDELRVVDARSFSQAWWDSAALGITFPSSG
jgi:hypothetical protein